MIRTVLRAALPLVALAALRPGHADDTFTYQWQGTVGPYRVGLSTTVRNDRTLVAAHYFYASRNRDIPLDGLIRGADVTFDEPGHGTFSLHLRGRSASEHPDLFSHALGLDGDWSKAGRTLPVRLELASGAPGGPPARHYASVTDATDAQFETMVRRFIVAVRDGDRPTAAALVSYPLRVNGPHPFTIASPAVLERDWDRTFTSGIMAALAAAVPHDMFVHDDEAMIGNGEVWFDAHGACAINPG